MPNVPGSSMEAPRPKPNSPEARKAEKSKAPAVELPPLGAQEVGIIARIDKAGDPDMVFKDIAVDSPPVLEVKDAEVPIKPLFITEDPRFDQIAKELSDSALEKQIQGFINMGKSRADALFHMKVFGSAREQADGSLRLQFNPTKIQAVFADRYPEDYAGYAKVEPLGDDYKGDLQKGFRFRQIARLDPPRAEKMAAEFQEQTGKPHAKLLDAIKLADELKSNPITVPPESPQFADLASDVSHDKGYKDAAKALEVLDRNAIFGTDDATAIKQMPIEKYRELANADRAISLSGTRDKRIQELFQQQNPDISRLYAIREKTRTYRDPDGVINPNLDPAYPGGLVPATETQGLRDFAKQYPEKAAAYAEVNPKLKAVLEQVNRTSVENATSTPVIETALPPVKKHETEPVVSTDIGRKIKEQVSDSMKTLSKGDLEKQRLELRDRPQLGKQALVDTLVQVDQEPTFTWVQTDKIVGRSYEQPDSWASEIEARKGRTVEVAKEIIDSDGNATAMEHVFHPDTPTQRIKLTGIDGPAGPMYYVDDGTHRVEGSMLAKLAEIPAEVKGVSYPLEQTAVDESQVYDWQRKIELGLIDGEIQDYTSENGNPMKKLVVKSETLPWIRTTSQTDLLKISKVYEELYPGSLDHLKIPRQALVDPIANSYFMAGRWEEWLQKQEEVS